MRAVASKRRRSVSEATISPPHVLCNHQSALVCGVSGQLCFEGRDVRIGGGLGLGQFGPGVESSVLLAPARVSSSTSNAGGFTVLVEMSWIGAARCGGLSV